jgi:hypothetical protein
MKYWSALIYLDLIASLRQVSINCLQARFEIEAEVKVDEEIDSDKLFI